MARPFKHPKTGVYWLRRHVPRDIRALDPTAPQEMRRSLGTKSPAEARRRFREMWEAIDKEFDAKRRAAGLLSSDGRTQKDRAADPLPVTLDDRQVAALAGEVYRTTIEDAGGVRNALIIQSWAWERSMLGLYLGEEPVPEAWGDWDMDSAVSNIMMPVVTKVLENHGLTVCDHTWERFYFRAVKAKIQALEAIVRQAYDDWRPDPAAENFPELKLPLTAASLWNAYVTERKTPQGTKKRWKPIYDDFVRFLGHMDMARVKEQDVRRWRDHLLEHLTPANVRDNYLICLKAIFGYAVRTKKRDDNPAKGVTVEIARREETVLMRGFSDEEAYAILAATLDPASPRMSAKRAAAQRWVPWICAYSGCRVNEATQLRACEIMRIDGIWCFRFTPEGGTTKSGRPRDIPIHPHLLEQGFLDYVERFNGDTPLFHNSTATDSDKLAKAAEIIGGRLATWVRSLDVIGADVAPNHGWRHRFKVECTGIIPEATIDYIQDHVPVNVGRKYNRPPPRKLKPFIDMIPRYDVAAADAGARKARRAVRVAAE